MATVLSEPVLLDQLAHVRDRAHGGTLVRQAAGHGNDELAVAAVHGAVARQEIRDLRDLRRRRPLGAARHPDAERGRLLRHQNRMTLIGIDQRPARDMGAGLLHGPATGERDERERHRRHQAGSRSRAGGCCNGRTHVPMLQWCGYSTMNP
jgi:hypothetical protein